jgi:predicted component of type VI protein secretion system
MMADIRRMAVNWVDGMKISRQHFVETDDYHTDQVRKAQAVFQTPLNYGLLISQEGTESLQMQVLGDASQQIRVKIDHFSGIAPDGSLLEIAEKDELRLDTSLAEMIEQYRLPAAQSLEIYIVINVSLFERKQVGTPLDSEIPIRHPHTLPFYKINLVPAELINTEQWSGAGLIIGKIEYNNSELRVMHDFIPACRAVKSHKGLREWYNRFGGYLNDIEMYSFRIMQKIKTKSQKSTLSDSVQMLVERLVNVFATANVSYQRLVPYEPPIHMVVCLIQVVQSIRTSLECLTDREKEELLGYLGEWADDSPGSLEKKILSVIQVPYNHNEMLPCLKTMDGFYSMWTALFLKLSQLEFIGKRKGQQVFIIESPVHEPPVQPEKTKSRWSPL